MKNRRSHSKIKVIANIFMVITVFAAWGYMFTNKEPGALASAGIMNLRYFTVLSNIAEGIVSLVWVILFLMKKSSDTIDRAKYVAAVSVALTFATIAFFLGPIYGHLSMYQGANFWFHLIIPIIAMIEYIFAGGKVVGQKENLIAVIPMLLYGCVYLVNVLIRGVEGNDWYGFVNWGLPIGILIFAIMCLATYGMGLVLRLLRAKVSKGDKVSSDTTSCD